MCGIDQQRRRQQDRIGDLMSPRSVGELPRTEVRRRVVGKPGEHARAGQPVGPEAFEQVVLETKRRCLRSARELWSSRSPRQPSSGARRPARTAGETGMTRVPRGPAPEHESTCERAVLRSGLRDRVPTTSSPLECETTLLRPARTSLRRAPRCSSRLACLTAASDTTRATTSRPATTRFPSRSIRR